VRYLTWHEHLMLAATFLFALAAGSVNPLLGVVGLAVTALVARWAVVAARPPRPMTPLAQRQREQLRAGVWR
jgi:hypothetical protein